MCGDGKLKCWKYSAGQATAEEGELAMFYILSAGLQENAEGGGGCENDWVALSKDLIWV